MKFDKLANQIIKEMLDPVDDIGPDEDPGSEGFTKRLRLEAEIEELSDKLGWPTENTSDMTVEELEEMAERLRQNFKISEYEPGPFK
jgi:hypothetical protein